MKIDNRQSKLFNYMKRHDGRFHIFILFVVCISILYSILPMIILRENYCFTIWDELDQYASFAKIFKEHHLYFHRNEPLPIMLGIKGSLLGFSYNLHDFLCCNIGYIPGQIITRIICITFGFFFMQLLLKRVFPVQTTVDLDLIYLVAIAYAITPSASNREIAFGTLPGIILLFIYLLDKEKLSPLVLIGFIIPFFSAFNAFLLFECGFWCIFSVVFLIKKRKVNLNLILTFVFLCLGTIFFYPDMFFLAKDIGETNRNLIQPLYSSNFFVLYKSYFMNNQAHTPTYHKYILLPLVIFSSVFFLFKLCISKQFFAGKRKFLILLYSLFCFFLLSTCIISLRESGFMTGISLIDGFDFGRIIGFNRIAWYLMIPAVFVILPSKKILKYFGCILILLQLIIIVTRVDVNILNQTNDAAYYMVADNNSTMLSVLRKKIGLNPSKASVSFKDFFSENLFNDIKQDLNYNGEGCAAYGIEPSVLHWNGFLSLDGYSSIHTMKYHNEFREIIAPALDSEPTPWFKDYYDYWGGRSYLFGDLYVAYTYNLKGVGPAKLLIDTNAFKKYGGKYILSRAIIENANELNLDLIKDYDRPDSLYHIWVYEVR